MSDQYGDSYEDVYGEVDASLEDAYSDSYGDGYGAPTAVGVVDVEPIAFDANSEMPLAPEVDAAGGDSFASGATGSFTVTAEVIPGVVTGDVASVAQAATGTFSAGDPTVVGPGGSDITVEAVTFRASGATYAQPSRVRPTSGRQLLTAPTAAVTAALTASQIAVWRVVDILNADETMWMPAAGFNDGSVSLDYTRDERRTLSLTLDNSKRQFDPDDKNFWYDKIIRPRRGVIIDGVQFEFDLGYFMIDQISRANKLNTAIAITGRDYTKKMIKSRLEAALSFKATDRLVDVLRALAFNSGVTRVSIPWENTALGRVYSFDADSTRWSIAKSLAEAFNRELYFAADGTLTMRNQRDPLTSPYVLTLGGEEGNAIDFGRSTNDDELYNHVVVVSTAGDQTIPVWASVENNEPSSPTRISKIGRRTKRIESAMVTTTAQCLALAKTYIAVSALEQFAVSFQSLNYPWLEVGDILRVLDGQAIAGDPTRFLLTTLSIPLKVGSMSGECKRITVVGTDYTVYESTVQPSGLIWGDEAA